MITVNGAEWPANEANETTPEQNLLFASLESLLDSAMLGRDPRRALLAGSIFNAPSVQLQRSRGS